MSANVEPGVYRHFKGGMYRVLFTAIDTTNGTHGEDKRVVIYLSLTTGAICARSEDEFTDWVTSTIDSEMYVPRFRYIGDQP